MGDKTDFSCIIMPARNKTDAMFKYSSFDIGLEEYVSGQTKSDAEVNASLLMTANDDVYLRKFILPRISRGIEAVLGRSRSSFLAYIFSMPQCINA